MIDSIDTKEKEKMKYSGYELWWLFFIYSFLGWVIETAVATGKKRRFVNRGVFSGPVCFVYGVSAVLMTVTLWELLEDPVFLFLGCTIEATVVEWVTGKVLERMNHHKWWDYSRKKWNFDGYICLSYSVLWGCLGVLGVCYGNEIFSILFKFLPEFVGKVLVYAMVFVGAVDAVVSLAAILHIQKRVPTQVQNFDRQLGLWTGRLRQWLVSHVENRMVRAYPGIDERTQKEKREGCFAEGCGFYKLFWLFFIGALLGDLVETVFCRYSMGRWMSRSSLVWGPFSIVWGLAIAAATMLLHRDNDKPIRNIFILGTLLGGAYEYICSVFTELVFGKVFWDYSKHPLNLGGRINLLFCLFWGAAAVVWIKFFYPKVSRIIEKIPQRVGKTMTWGLVLFLSVNILVSMLALIRYDTRSSRKEAAYRWERVMDEHFDDIRMEEIYPNAIKR